MADSIKISLPDIYEAITEDDIRKAKQWTLLRNRNASLLSGLIEDILEDTARELTKIAYKYNCRPEDWQFSENEDLREDVAILMNDVEDRIFELVEDYSLNETDDKKKRSNLLPWLMALKSKGAKDLASTLHMRLRQFLFDTEAQIAAMKLAKYKQTKAINRILSTLHSVYTSPEMLSAFKKKSAAKYIQSRGVHDGNVGLSSSGANNVENFGRQSAVLGWEKSRYEREKEEGKTGYMCFRGSTFPCPACDDVCSYVHKIEEGMVLPVHSNCCCYAVFIEEKEEEKQETLKEQRKRIKEEAAFLQDEVFENKDIDWKASISGAGIKEWINQPHKNYREKNEALLDLRNIFKNAEYIKPIKDSKGREAVKNSHIFKTSIAGEDSWLIVHEMVWGDYYIHSISDRNPIK